MGRCHPVSNGDEDQLAAAQGNGHANRNNNTAGLLDAHADEYTAAAGTDFDHGSVIPGRRAIEDAGPNSNKHGTADRNGDTGATGNGDKHPFTHGDFHGDSVAYAIAYIDIYSDAHAFAHADVYAVPHCDLHADANANSDTLADDDGQHHAYANTNYHGHAAALSLPIIWQRVARR